MTVRPIAPAPGMRLDVRPLAGCPGRLEWLPLAALVVDERYQRAVGKEGRANIQRIAERFDWRKFAPVITVALGDGRYAVVDGQHRSIAAATRGDVGDVPALVLDMTPEEAAAAFAAINGAVTGITGLQLYAARLAAGEPSAKVLQGVLDEAGVRVLRYKFVGTEYQVGDTLAIGTLEKCLRTYGRDVLKAALLAVTRSFDGNPGCLTAPIISALCAVLHERPDWRALGERLWEAMDEAGLPTIESQAADIARAEGKRRPVVMRELVEAVIETGLAVCASAASVAEPEAVA